MDHFWFIYGAVFLDNLFLQSYFPQKLIACPSFAYISDFVCILAKRYCKPFMTSAYTLPGKSKKKKKFAVKLVTRKRKHFWVPYYIIDIPIYLNIRLMTKIYLQIWKLLFGFIYPKMLSFKGIYFTFFTLSFNLFKYSFKPWPQIYSNICL